jgi:dipeptidase E
MRLYLSSFDLGDRPEELVALIGTGRRAAVIVNALDNFPRDRAAWLTDQTNKLAHLGLRVTELDLRRYFGASEELRRFLDDVDLVWANGGNSFILRRAMKQSGFDTVIRSAVVRDEIVYGGFSAGSAVVAASLRGIELIDVPDDVPHGYDASIVWEGLGLVTFSLAAHFRSNHPEAPLVERVVAFFEGNGIPYRALRDGEALIINGNEERIVGRWRT